MNKTIKATTLSVIMKDSETVHCYVRAHGEDCNLTLRFDRGAKAMLCGYPETWDIHDVNVDPYDSESPTGADLFECDAIRDGRTYISADDEREILKALKRSVARQFRDPMWAEYGVTKRRKEAILRKIQRAVDRLKAVSGE